MEKPPPPDGLEKPSETAYLHIEPEVSIPTEPLESRQLYRLLMLAIIVSAVPASAILTLKWAPSTVQSWVVVGVIVLELVSIVFIAVRVLPPSKTVTEVVGT